MKRRHMEAPLQLVLLHLCCTCHELVPFERALQINPESYGANCPVHPACIRADRRWNPFMNALQWEPFPSHAKAARS
jgi:hypothetical protein